MVKRISRRFVSLLLTFVTILTMLPAMTLPALAATSGTVTGLADENIGLSFTGDADNAWSANGTSIIGAATSRGGICSDTSYKSTLTITNKRSTTATLSFDYSIEQNSGKIQVDGTEVSSGASFTKELTANESVKVSIESGSTSAATKITLTNVVLVSNVNATATFVPAENGTYTVDGKLITEEYRNTQSSMTAYQVVATPADGYQFLGWYNVTEKKYINTSPKAALNIESNCTITARFASKTAALFETKGQRFDNLNDAITEAQKNLPATIALVSDGSITGDYTIPSGVTLLIPFDEAGTLYKATPTATHKTSATKPFRTLTMAAGSSITLASGAAISVGGQYYAAGGGEKGQMAGPYGYIKMASDSAITVQSGGALYAWGFISGNGSVTVKDGGSVYEWYQILDFRGGSATIEMKHEVFPFNQYAVQNIEVPMTLYAGASETAYAAIYALSTTYNSSISFIGAGSLFELTSGRLTKAYDGSTDRMIYTIDGIAKLNSLTLTLAGKEVNSSSYVLPLTNNMTIDLKSGSKLTLNQTAALLPGVKVSIARDAELEVPNGQSMYIYDKQEWGGYCGNGEKYIPVVNAPGKAYNRTDNDLVDVKVDVNGKLTAIGGIYTTESGANICSSEGTGKYVQQSAPGTETATYQYDGGTKSHTIPITPAKLHNADNSYTETAKASTGQTIPYCTCPTCSVGGGKWLKDFAAIIDSTGKHMEDYPTLQEAVNAYNKLNESTASKTYIQMLHSTTGDSTTGNVNTNKDLYLDLNGCTVKGNISVTGTHKLYGMDSSAGADYVTAPGGKIVGTVTGTVAPTYQTPTVKVENVDTYDRYVAISGLEADGKTANLSFHHFNISVTGYRFELAAPQCALFFIGTFRGDDAAKAYLSKLGFTLKGNNDMSLGEADYVFTADTVIPPESEPGDSPVVLSGDAYLFEVYLNRSFKKDEPNGYTEKIGATAQATFKNGGTQNSEMKQWSFEDAWTESEGLKDLTPEQKAILDKFLKELGITKQAE